jgi:queuine tRNA-ribosyltransferase
VSFGFQVTHTDGAARRGRMATPHGDVETPAFMPVGTQGAVKGVTHRDLESLGAEILLSNTYHLYLRPGDDLIARRGGLHTFIGWPRPILTDSGGYQVFSMASRRTIDEQGAHFRSHLDGSAHLLTPEKAADIQAQLGSDVAMCLDVCPPDDASPRQLEEAVRLTTHWAERQLATERVPAQLVFGIAQVGTDRELRERSIGEITSLGFDGYALGGLAIGEDRTAMFETVGWAAPLLPAAQARYFMGIGDAEGILEVIARGIDMFDCVLPTRLGRTGTAVTPTGRLNLKNARFARDPNPIQDDCDCPACTRFSRAYIRHLVNQQELLGLRLLSLHNLRFLLALTAGARAAIERNEFDSYKRDALARLEPVSPEAS